MELSDKDLTTAYTEVANTSFVGLKKKETSSTVISKPFTSTGARDSCLTCFISLRINHHNHHEHQHQGSDVHDVNMLWSHPHHISEVLQLYPNIEKFALANAGTSLFAEKLTYTFVLTDGRGVRMYGHTAAFVNGEVVVCLSPYPWCNFFHRVAYLYQCNGAAGKDIIRALCRTETPPSGAAILTPTDLQVSFRRPYDRLCSFIDTRPLEMLSIFPNIQELFSILADLLCEKHIVIVGPHFSVVSNVVMSLQALIAPFDWMHILIPILPSALIDVLAAPPPYLVGILTSQLSLVSRVPMDAVVMVHLGASGVCERVEYIDETPGHLPHSGRFSALNIGLNLLKLRDPRDQTVRDLCSLFLSYYASLFGEVVLKGGKGYIKSHSMSPSSVAFFEALMRTQSFHVLNEEVSEKMRADSTEWMENEFIVAATRANPDVFAHHYKQLIEAEKEGGGYVEQHEDCFGSKESFTSLTAAIHGFGGHPVSTLRLLARCLCRCRSEDDDDADAYYPGATVASHQVPHRTPTASSTPVIVPTDEQPPA